MADGRQSQLIQFDSATTYTLTTSYVASNPIRAAKAYQVGLDISYTQGAAETANTLDIKIEISNVDTTPTATDWFQMSSESTSSGLTTSSYQNYRFTAVATAGTADRFHISFPIDVKWVRVSVREGGVAANAGTFLGRLTVSENFGG